MYRKCRIAFCLLLMAVVIPAEAGGPAGMSVLNFAEDPTDMTANLKGTTVYDQNGSKCALIKIRTIEKDFAFDTGMMAPVEVLYDEKNHPGEIWLYVPYGIKKITIQHPLLGSVDYPITIQIQRAHTYVMDLVTDRVETTVRKSLNSQYLIFNVVPEDAAVVLNNKLLKTENGCAWSYVKFGKYEWKVLAGEYYLPQSGTVTVSDSKSAVIRNITLQPSFGTLSLPQKTGSACGASVYVDGERVGTVPLNGVKLLEGRHELILVKDKFRTVGMTLDVVKGEEKVLNLDLEADSCPVELSADYGARICIDGEDCGLSNWKGELSSGVHIVSTSKEYHKDSEQAIEISRSRNPVRIRLDSPVLKTGSINVDVTPYGSDVFVDGEKCGKTPYVMNDAAMGEHNIAVANSFCHTLYSTVFVEEGQTATIKEELNQTVDVVLDSNAPGAVFTIDGGHTSYSGETVRLELGQHTVDVSAIGYRRRSRKVDVLDNTYRLKVRLKHTVYISGGIGLMAGGTPNESTVSSTRSDAGVAIGLPLYFTVGTSSNFLNLRVNLTPSLSVWEKSDPLVFCPASVGARLRFGMPEANFFFEPEFGYNLMADDLGTPFFGGRTGMGCGALDISFGCYWSCLDNKVYPDQIRPLYWCFGLIFNFRY